MKSGKVGFQDRLFDFGCLQRMKDDTSSSEARVQCLANWTRLFQTKLDIVGRSPYELVGSVKPNNG